MYVCICNALKEAEVRAAARKTGSGNPSVAYRSLGCAFQCGQCRGHAKKVVAEEAGHIGGSLSV